MNVLIQVPERRVNGLRRDTDTLGVSMQLNPTTLCACSVYGKLRGKQSSAGKLTSTGWLHRQRAGSKGMNTAGVAGEKWSLHHDGWTGRDGLATVGHWYCFESPDDMAVLVARLNALESRLARAEALAEAARQERDSFIDGYAARFPESRLAYSRRAEDAEAALEEERRRAEENAAKADYLVACLQSLRDDQLGDMRDRVHHLVELATELHDALNPDTSEVQGDPIATTVPSEENNG